MEIKEVISQMTLEEKATLLNGFTFFGMAEIQRLGINGLFVLDGGTGVNYEQLYGEATMRHGWKGHYDMRMVGSYMLLNVINNCFETDNLNQEEMELYNWINDVMELPDNYAPGCYPPGIMLGATWNEEVVYNVGEALAMDAILHNIDILLGTPNVNLHRDPLNGRLFEGYSEDPYLISKLAPMLVKGVQQSGVVANVKHFAANNQETNRIGINETISKRALEEIYLPGFKACVKDGNVKTVMSAYNKINGVPCTENSWLLKKKLIDEWGFDGFVMSDWGAVSNPVEALIGGNDLNMPGYHEHDSIVNAVKNGCIDEKTVDESVEKILRVYNWRQENKKKLLISTEDVTKFTDDAAYNAAVEGIVLLENKNALPIAKDKKLLLLGTDEGRILYCGAGSAGIKTNRADNLYKELAKCYGQDNLVCNEDEADYVIYVCRVGGMEGNDRKNLFINKDDAAKINKITKPVILILNTCGPVVLSGIKANVVGVLAVFLPGMMGCKAISDIISGSVSPSGKLPITFPKRYEDTPASINFPGDGYNVNYGEGIFVGYRYYDIKSIEPLYAFGFGLSYSTFSYEVINSNAKEIIVNKSTPFSVDIKITNTGNIKAKQVVQLYISDIKSSITKPVKELKGFKKVSLEAGETKIINMKIDADSFASFDMDYDKWIVEEGYYDIIIASSSRKEDEISRIKIYMDVESPYSYNSNSSVKTAYENDEIKTILQELCKKYEMDFSFVSNCYQYMANKSVFEMLQDLTDLDESKMNKFIQEFDYCVKQLRKE